MHFAYFAFILACLSFNKNVVAANAIKVERYPSPAHVERSNLSTDEDDSGIADTKKSAWIKVRMFSLLNTYAEVLERSLDKLDDLVGPEANIETAIKSPYSQEITKEIKFMVDFSRTTLTNLQAVESNKPQQKIPEKIPEVADIAEVLFKVGESFKPFWSRISRSYRLNHDDDWLSKLHEILDIYCEIIKCCVNFIKELISEIWKDYLPDFNEFNSIGFGLEKIVQVLKTLHSTQG